MQPRDDAAPNALRILEASGVPADVADRAFEIYRRRDGDLTTSASETDAILPAADDPAP